MNKPITQMVDAADTNKPWWSVYQPEEIKISDDAADRMLKIMKESSEPNDKLKIALEMNYEQLRFK